MNKTNKYHYIRTIRIIKAIADKETRKKLAKDFSTWYSMDNKNFNKKEFMRQCTGSV